MNTTRKLRLTAVILVGTLASASSIIGQDAATDAKHGGRLDANREFLASGQ